MTSYFQKVTKQLNLVEKNQKGQIAKAVEVVSSTLRKSGLIYVFGCGHSHMFGEELFYRAGGLANVVPILHEPLMLHNGAMQSSVNERKNNYINNFIQRYNITSDDVLIVVSTSGINPVPIDVAKYFQNQGSKVITISSHIYQVYEESRHDKGYYLTNVGDINIDNQVSHGDTVCTTKKINHTPISTIIGMTIIHELMAQAINKTEFNDVFKSGNIAGSKKHNQELVQKYEKKIPLLTKNLEIKL